MVKHTGVCVCLFLWWRRRRCAREEERAETGNCAKREREESDDLTMGVRKKAGAFCVESLLGGWVTGMSRAHERWWRFSPTY